MSLDGIVRTWEVASGEESQRFLSQVPGALGIHFAPDGASLWVITENLTLHSWNLTTGEGSEMRLEGANQPQAVAFAPNGRYLATGNDRIVTLWGLADGEILGVLDHPREPVQTLTFSSDSRILLLGSRFGSVKFAEVAALRYFDSLPNMVGAVEAIAVSPNGRRMVTAYADGTAFVWRTRNPDGSLSLTEAELSRLWARVGSDDPEVADQALATLASSPTQAVDWIAKHLGWDKPDPDSIRCLIACMDSADADVVQRATEYLLQFGPPVALWIEEAQQSPLSLRHRFRLEILAIDLEEARSRYSPLRYGRAVSLLRRLDTPAADQLLGTIEE